MEKRKYPVELWQAIHLYDEWTEKIVINIPEGKTLAEMPENADFENKYGHYKMTFTQEDNRLIVHRSLTLKHEDIEVEEYPGFKDFFLRIMESDDRQLAFTSK